MDIAELESKVMKLDLSSRAALAEKLLESLDDLSESERGELWAAEAERRLEELDNGKVRAIDGETVLREIEDDLLFEAKPTEVRFVAAMQHKRRPNYWIGRLR